MSKLYFKVASDWQEVVRLREEISKLKQELTTLDVNKAPAAAKVLQTQISTLKQEMNGFVSEAAQAGTAIEGGFKKKIFDASQSVNGFTEKIIAQKAVVKDVEADVKRLGEAYHAALKRNPLSANGKLSEYTSAKKALDEEKAALFGLTQQQAEARLSVKKLRDEYSLYKDDAKDVVDTNNGIAISWKKALAVIGGVAALKALGSEIIRVRGEFQSMQTAMETMVGKDVAGPLMAQVKELAKISPLTMTDMVSAEKMMLGFNIQADDTIKYLKALSDISMGESGKFNSLTLAFSQMSAAGKLMGQDLNQMINAGFNPLQSISEKTGKSIATLKDEMSKGAISAEMVQQAFIDATSAGGKFYGMSENASKTINGQISMMQDALDEVFNELGTKGEGVIMSGIQMTTSLIKNYETVGKVLTGLVAVYGTYRTALVLNIALEKAQAMQRLASIKGMTMMKMLTDMLTGSVTKLNAALVGKGFAMIGGAAVASSLLLLDWANKQDKCTKAVDRFNKEQNAAEKVENKRRLAVESAISIASDEKKSTKERTDAIGVLKQMYKEILPEYDKETFLLKNILDYKNKINDADERSKRIGYKTKLVMLDNDIAKYETGLKEANKQGAGQGTQGIMNEINNLKKERELIQGVLNEMQKGLSPSRGKDGKPVLQNKEYWENLKKEAETSLFALSDVEAAGKKGLELKKKIAGYTKKIDSFSTNTSKQESADEKLRKETDKYNVLLSKQALEQKRSAEDLQMQADEARIKAMDEGSKKTIAEMELNFEKEMQVIDRQKEDLLRKKIEDARSAWEADPKNKKKSFDASGIKLSDSEQKYFDELYKAAIDNNEKTYSDLADKYQSYTDQRLEIEKKFNDDIAVLQEARKKAVEKGDTDEVSKINRSIAKATADKGKELMKHDFDVLKQSPEYIRAFEDLRNTSSETLSSLLDQLENAKQTAAETLNPEDLREYTTTIQEIMDELDSRNPFQALADRQKELAEAEQELAEAKKRLDAVNKGTKIVTGVKSTSLGDDGKIKIENTYLTAAEALKKYNEAKDKSQKANNNFIKAEKTAKDKVDELVGAIKGIGDVIGGQAGEIISLMGDVALFATDTIDGISKVTKTGVDAMSAVEKASVILGIISTAIQLLQKISELGENKAFKQYEAYAEKIKEINALTDAVNEYRIAALEASQAEANWFSEDNLKSLRDYKKLHDEVAKAYADKAMESQAVYQNQSGGGWLTGAVNWVMGNLSPLALLGDKWKDIWGQGNYNKGQTAAVNNLRIETRKKSSGFLGTGIGGKSQKTEDLVTWAKNQGLGDLFDNEGLLNKELAQSLIDNYGNKLVGQTKETLESLIKLREQYDEYIEKLHEYVSSLYEPLVDNFVDSLWDWLDDGKDALDSFKSYASGTFRDIVSDMMRTIILDKVVDGFDDDIAKLYEKYASGKLSEEELMKQVADRTGSLVDNYEKNIPTLENMLSTVNGYFKDAGIDLAQPEDSSREATQKGIATASQDSVDENNGRLAVIQTHTYGINENVNRMVTGIDTIANYTANLSCLTNIDKTIQSLLTMRNEAIGHLSNIANYTSNLVEMKQDMHSMKQDVNTMLIKGMKLSKN